MNADENLELINLLELEYADVICHLKLRRIREIQAPWFDEVKDQPAIKKTFLEARGIHDKLRESRMARIAKLLQLIEQPLLQSYLISFTRDYKIGKGKHKTKKGTSKNVGTWKHA